MTRTNLPLAVDGSERKILVAIDFGTTFSGVAWAQTARPENQSIISQWSDESGSLDGATKDKVPTELCYNGGDCKWGFQIPDTESRYQRFKLALDPETTKKVSYLDSQYPDPKALSANKEKPVATLTIDYLTCLRKHILEVLKNKLGQGVLDTTEIEFIITVPAIWKDAAKFRTRSCAKQAGLSRGLQLISEPEAAVIYTLDAMDPHKLDIGDTFVLCDAGGGTVDLVTYSIEELKPIVKVSEAVEGDGDSCGSTVLNQMFRVWLQGNYGDHDGWDDDTLEEAMDRFENSIKPKFSGSEVDVLIPVPGLTNDRTKGIMRGKLTVSASIIRSIFDPVISTITTLVSVQINRAPGNVKAVLLVGGFGQSPYLRESIKRIVGPGIEVMQPAKGWTAVVRGGLLRALTTGIPNLSRIRIGSRVARKCYGIESRNKFVQDKHQQARKFWCSFSGFNRINIVDWLLKQGETVKEDEPLKLTFFHASLIADGALDPITVTMLTYESPTMRKPPQYSDQGAEELVRMTADLSTIPTYTLPIKTGADGNRYYHINYNVHVKFLSAHIEYSLWYDGKCYGSVEAEYV